MAVAPAIAARWIWVLTDANDRNGRKVSVSPVSGRSRHTSTESLATPWDAWGPDPTRRWHHSRPAECPMGSAGGALIQWAGDKANAGLSPPHQAADT